MKGGSIIGNLSFFSVASAKAQASGNAMGRSAISSIPGVGGVLSSPSSNSPSLPDRKGGGVYVSYGGTFTKTGGTIAGLTNNPKSSNAVIDPNGKPIPNCGHAVFAADGSKRKETTAGPDVNLHIGNGTFSGGWDF